MFDPVAYFETLKNSLKITKTKYLFSKISGLTELEGILANRKRHLFHVAVDDSENGATIQGAGRGYWERRPYTVFLCAVTKTKNIDAREAVLNELRAIYRSFMTKMILDNAQQPGLFVDLARTPFYELPGAFADGVVGIYFIVTVDNQIDLSYVATDWE